MSRNTLIGILVVIVAIVLGFWVWWANQPRPVIEVRSGETSVSIGSGGIGVQVPAQ